MNVTGLNHAVLWVRDASRSAEFYHEVLGFQIAQVDASGQAIFLRAGASSNHHDLGLISVGDRPPAASHAPGLYHLAWQVDQIEDLDEITRILSERGALVGLTDHGVSKSAYGRDIDGIEFEVMWRVPPEHWGDDADRVVVEPLDLKAEVARWDGIATGAVDDLYYGRQSPSHPAQ